MKEYTPKILIIDDDTSTCTILQRIFEKKGYKVGIASNGKDGIEMAGEGDFDLVCIEKDLPDIDGIELIPQLKEIWPEMRAIMVTGNAKAETIVKAINIGASGYIVKPVRQEELLAVIRENLKERRHLKEMLQAERNLKVEQKQAQRIAHLGNWEWNDKEQILCWSDEMYDIFGVEKDFDPTFDGIETMVHPEDRERNKVFITGLVSGSGPTNINLCIVRPDGSLRFIYQSAEVFKDKEGDVIRLFGIIYDVTEQEENRLEILKSRDQLRELSHHLQNAWEEQNTYIAREIHDDVGQTLTGLAMLITLLEEELKEKKITQSSVSGLVQELKEELHKGINKIRTLSSELRPVVLETNELTDALGWLTNQFNKHPNLEIKVDIPQTIESLGPARDLAVFRIVQESFTNIIRHSQAQRVELHVSQDETRFHLEVKDDGIGFSKQEDAHFQSFGLMSMRERALFCRGIINIISIKGKGTEIAVDIPQKV
jgi:signal transduction histidine kinase